jgi:uncharacterized protein YndB with AHSA1/START domain
MPHEFALRKEIELEATPDRVWEAIATGPGLASWFMPMEVDPDDAGTAVWDPPRRLEIRTPAAEDGETHTFEYLVEGKDGGRAVLRFVHSGIGGDGWDAGYEAMTSDGWDMYLHTLAQYLTHFPGRHATYVTAEAPPSSAQAETWPVLLRGLGLTEAAAPGDRVRLTAAGAPPLDGVVDYVGPAFVGIRTDDALYRFHGRAALGLPVAVGHHLYAGDVDAAETERAWQAWLDGVYA